ncbi:rhodanese-like domain-containing protein [Priestia aryabhattai]|uniref:rhodanese-like domain-containing protein n=1 Tax=Priestia aryabhattai TaxID=412384 RepID=UPI003982D5D8
MKQVILQEVEQLMNEQKPVRVLGVREVEEVKVDKISNTWNTPLPLLEFQMNELDKSIEYIVVCRSGGRSSMAARLLEK